MLLDVAAVFVVPWDDRWRTIGPLSIVLVAALTNGVGGDVVKLLPPNQHLVRIEIAGAYECRGRNRVAAAKLSEHATGNAIDITAFVTGKDQRLEIARQASASAFFTALQSSACKTFMTVLGPGSDGFHETHLHLDLQQRSNGSHFCQWTVGG